MIIGWCTPQPRCFPPPLPRRLPLMRACCHPAAPLHARIYAAAAASAAAQPCAVCPGPGADTCCRGHARAARPWVALSIRLLPCNQAVTHRACLLRPGPCMQHTRRSALWAPRPAACPRLPRPARAYWSHGTSSGQSARAGAHQARATLRSAQWRCAPARPTAPCPRPPPAHRHPALLEASAIGMALSASGIQSSWFEPSSFLPMLPPPCGDHPRGGKSAAGVRWRGLGRWWDSRGAAGCAQQAGSASSPIVCLLTCLGCVWCVPPAGRVLAACCVLPAPPGCTPVHAGVRRPAARLAVHHRMGCAPFGSRCPRCIRGPYTCSADSLH
jgi:hypothetical protein